jgi:hypothetical protein
VPDEAKTNSVESLDAAVHEDTGQLHQNGERRAVMKTRMKATGVHALWLPWFKGQHLCRG